VVRFRTGGAASPHIDVPRPVGPTAALEYYISPGSLAAPGDLSGLPEGRRGHPGSPIGPPTRVAPTWGNTFGLPGGPREHAGGQKDNNLSKSTSHESKVPVRC